MTADASDVVLHAENITKSYGGVRALKGVAFTAYRGAVNVLVGENGAGKSTLMKILAGSEEQTSGRILLDGQEVSFRSPRDAMAAGIGIIHQELSLFPNLSIAENIFAGVELRSRNGLVDFGTQRDRARTVLQRLGQDLDPNTLVGRLPIGQQQLVEIARVLNEDVRILIMDEPTSALSNHEVDVLFDVMADLRREEVTIVYISHKLDEFRRIGDYVTVFRDGSVVASAPMRETSTGWIVQQMVGRNPDTLFTRSDAPTGDVLLSVSGLTSVGPSGAVVDDVSFEVRAGEVVGIYGLMGAGRTELLECLIGSRQAVAGEVQIRGRLASSATVADRLASGLALVPEDRQRDGLVPTASVKNNVVLSTLSRLARGPFLSSKVERETAQSQITSLGIKVSSMGAPIGSLSGGNQQKVVLGRALLTAPTVLLLDEPTRGIDVGAKAEISRVMSDLSRTGIGVLFTSSELAEVLAMADRILVMAKGRITATFVAGHVTEPELVAASAPDNTVRTAS